MFDLIFWSVIMLGLVTATIVAAMREKKARVKAVKSIEPQPLGDEINDDSMEAGFGEADPVDSFGESADGEFASLDEDAFK